MARKLQGIYCCPGVRIYVTDSDIDQDETRLFGECPECKAHWAVTIRREE